jgi:isobutyryl-CoA mutase
MDKHIAAEQQTWGCGAERRNQVNEKYVDEALQKLKKTAIENGNIFAELMNTVQVASLGQITQALYEVGGQYRRNM